MCWYAFLRQRGGAAQADHVGNILRAGAPAALVSGPVDERLQRYAPPHDQRADAFRSVDLVPGDRHEIDAQREQLEW
jgi:hypothetical protein